MTENEDIEKILYMGVGRSGIDNENSKIAKALNELMQHRAIGTVEEFKALKEKSVAKKAIGERKHNEAYCPVCNEVISDGEFWALNEYVHHCNECGQSVKGVDWQ